MRSCCRPNPQRAQHPLRTRKSLLPCNNSASSELRPNRKVGHRVYEHDARLTPAVRLVECLRMDGDAEAWSRCAWVTVVLVLLGSAGSPGRRSAWRDGTFRGSTRWARHTSSTADDRVASAADAGSRPSSIGGADRGRPPARRASRSGRRLPARFFCSPGEARRLCHGVQRVAGVGVTRPGASRPARRGWLRCPSASAAGSSGGVRKSGSERVVLP
jgi:hypothetical protein